MLCACVCWSLAGFVVGLMSAGLLVRWLDGFRAGLGLASRLHGSSFLNGWLVG